jgi:glucose/arabinose dehydrogenase
MARPSRKTTVSVVALVVIVAVAAGVVLVVGPWSNTATARPTIDLVSKRTVTTGLTSPWGLAFLPDGSALVSERDTGDIRRIPARADGQPARALTKAPKVGTVSGVRPRGEGGLLGITVPPTKDDEQPDFIFAYFTGAKDNRVVRIDWDGKELGRQTAIVTGIPKNTYHDGGRLLVDEDENLYIATGDAGVPELSQDPGSLAGKVLRVDFDGNPAAGNPSAGSPVYTLGHRNVSLSTLRDVCGQRNSEPARPTS